jgi:hypothetical protein
MKLTPDELLEIAEGLKGGLPDPSEYPHEVISIPFNRLDNPLAHLNNEPLTITSHTVRFRKAQVVAPYSGKGYLAETWEFDGID